MKKYVLPLFVFIIAICISLYNVGNFPKMIGDEGIYISQAYWLTHFKTLGPYTYWYDHFPLGWAQIGLWQLLVGPQSFFGYSVLSARVFMGLILGGTTTLLFLIIKKLTYSKFLSLSASLIFITSALTLTFGRMVLLDNLAIFWFLLSLLTLISRPSNIKNLALSGLFLGISILTKESLLFFLPPYLFLSYFLNKDNSNQKYATLINFTTIFFLLSFFPILAILKNEFLSKANQVSFLGTIFFQASRGSGIPFWDPSSHFNLMLKTWMKIDPILLILGTGTTLLSLLLPLPKIQKILSSFALFFLLFLLRGGQIYEFYLIPLIPILVINLSFVLDYFHKLTRSHFLTIFVLISFLGYLIGTNLYPFSSLSTSTQLQSIDTLKSLPSGSTIVANNYAYLDLYLDGKSKIEWYQKLESDPSVRQNTGKITHILTDFQFDDELTGHQLPYLESLLKSQKSTTKFGILPAPGQNIKPYTNEFLSLYTFKESTAQVQTILTLPKIDSATLSSLASNPPVGILISRNNFVSTSDLQTKINSIKTTLPTTQILVSQDSEGHNTIPWVNTNARSFFKSANEAIEATSIKANALETLGFTGVIVSTTQDEDNLLQTIVEATSKTLTPYLLYTGSVPTFKGNIVANNQEDLEILKESNYPGNIFLLTNQ
jgi:hypothetical protein